MNEIIKLCAKDLIIVPVLLEIYLFWKLDRRNRRQMVILLAVTAILAGIFAYSLGHLYYDPRPQFKDGATPLFPHGNDNGFPSDHTLLASVLALVAYRFNRPLGYVLGLITVIIGWARVAAHVHHGIDIIGSIAITVLAYIIALQVMSRSETTHQHTDTR